MIEATITILYMPSLNEVIIKSVHTKQKLLKCIFKVFVNMEAVMNHL